MKKVVIFSILGAIVVVLAVVYFVFSLTGGLPRTADNFFKAARDNNIDKAYTFVSRDFRANTSKEELALFIKQNKLDKFKDASWSSREINNDQGTVKGTVTTDEGGKLPLTMTFIKEDNDWKILAINKANSGVTENFNSKEMPPPARLKKMAAIAVFNLGSAINSADFTGFYSYIARIWQSQTTKEDLYKIFRDFHDKKIDLTAAGAIEPVLSEKPYLDADGRLQLKGYFPTKPSMVYFDLTYFYEDPEWKLGGIHVKVQ